MFSSITSLKEFTNMMEKCNMIGADRKLQFASKRIKWLNEVLNEFKDKRNRPTDSRYPKNEKLL